jgi:ABC-type transporter MlaC component
MVSGMRATRVLRRTLGAHALILLAMAAAEAQPADQSAAMARTVLDQLAAFRRGDWAAAYAFASSAIRARFGPEDFRAMVTQGYAAIARSASAAVGRVEALDGQRGLVEVRVEGENGETIDALYELVEEQGAWRVNGVMTRPVTRGTTARVGPDRPSPEPPHAWRPPRPARS